MQLKIIITKLHINTLSKNGTNIQFIIYALLIMCFNKFYAQNFKDTLRINDSTFNDKIIYSANDSIYTDLKKKQIHLFGKAQIEHTGIKMTAGYLMMDLEKREITAMYGYDKDSNRIDHPVFTDGSEQIKASKIRYNLDTKKGYIDEVEIKQQEAILYMEVAKKHENDEIHFKKGRFTTCDLPEPHYHFQLSKAILIPDKRIVSGPMNLWIQGVPSPLGLPFAVIPQQKKRTHGFLFPEIIPSSVYGFGFQNLGYYIPINDRLQTTVTTTLLSRGSWGVGNLLDYAKIYGYRGSVNASYQQFREGFPTNARANKLSLYWQHKQDPKANPYWNFGANVNFMSDNQSKNNLNPNNPNYFNNTFTSDITINRNFPGKPITTGAKLSVRQNSQTKNISLVSPVLNLNVTRVFPFAKFIRRNNAWARAGKQLGITYSFEMQNRSTFKDTLLNQSRYDLIGKQFYNGINQGFTVQTNFSFLKNTLKLNPSITYGNKMNFQQTRKSYDAINNTTKNDSLPVFAMGHELNFNISATTVLYSYYRFIGKNKPLLRHILTPSVSFRYSPKLNSYIEDSVGVNKALVRYSRFEQSMYNVGNFATSSIMSFGINNTFELKKKSDKDTVTGFKKTRIVDQFSITGFYDFAKDSMQLSDLKFDLRISPFPWLNFVASSNYTFYGWIDSNNLKIKDFALKSNGRLGRFTNHSFATTFVLTSKKSQEILEEKKEILGNQWNADFNYYALHPEYIVDFDIPWKVSLSHILSIDLNTQKDLTNNRNFNVLQTLSMDGDLSITKRWKIATTMYMDLKQVKIINTRFTVTRDMHCWALSLMWTPIGGNKSFLFSIRNTSSMFSSLKFDLRKPPVFL